MVDHIKSLLSVQYRDSMYHIYINKCTGKLPRVIFASVEISMTSVCLPIQMLYSKKKIFDIQFSICLLIKNVTKTSPTPSLFIEVPVPSQESLRSDICVLSVSLYDFYI